MILYIIKEVREELGIKLETLSKLSGIHAIESVTMNYNTSKGRCRN